MNALRARIAVQIEVLLIFLMGITAVFPLSGWAAMCASVGVDNVLTINAIPVGECTSLIVLESMDWVGASVWQFPTNAEIGEVWAAAFMVPMFLYLFAWGVGRIVNFFFKR